MVMLVTLQLLVVRVMMLLLVLLVLLVVMVVILKVMIPALNPPLKEVGRLGLSSCPVGSHFHTGAEIGRGGSGRRGETISSSSCDDAGLFSQPRNFVVELLLLLLLTMMLVAVGRRRRG